MVEPITVALGFIYAHPIIAGIAATGSAVGADFVYNLRSRINDGTPLLDQVGKSLGDVAYIILGPLSRGAGESVGSSVVDMAEGLGTSILSGVSNRIDRAGQYFEKTTLSKWFGAKNLSSNPDEYVDITQLAYRRFTDILSENATTLTTLTGFTGLGIGAYLGHRALEMHQDKKGSQKEKMVYATSAGASILLSTYMLGRAAFSS